MRTTLTIDDDVLAVARTLAAQTGSSLGSAVSELARRGFTSARTTGHDDVPAFRVDEDAPSITNDHVIGALSDWP